MNLSQEELQRIGERLDRAGVPQQIPCPLCRRDEWRVLGLVAPHFVQPDGGAIERGGAVMSLPLVPSVCGNCGHTWFLSAAAVGLTGGGT